MISQTTFRMSKKGRDKLETSGRKTLKHASRKEPLKLQGLFTLMPLKSTLKRKVFGLVRFSLKNNMEARRTQTHS